MANQVCVASTRTCATVKRIFATKTLYNGNLGGLAGADQKCMTAAQAAVLGGTWKAWLSDGSTDAINRIAEVGPWYRLGSSNVKLFNNKANLTTLPLDSVQVNEDGVSVSGGVWTGTVVGGTRATVHCNNWASAQGTMGTLTGQSGDSTSAAYWTDWGASKCDEPRRLYCIEQ
jgi:hypothetical protein